jgi:hypothetical protein
VVTPHASALGARRRPAPRVANLRALAARFPSYGDFGFYDAVDPATGAVAPVYLTLDQAMIFLATRTGSATAASAPLRARPDRAARPARPARRAFFD